MKKFWVVMLSLGLIAALALPAAAAEVKLSGSWYMIGWYVDNPSGLDKGTTYPNDPSWGGYATNHPRYATAGSPTMTGDPRHNRGASSFYSHKLTLRPEIQVVEGLKLVTQLTALQTVMGDNSWKATGGGRFTPTPTTILQNGGGYEANGVFIHENIDIAGAWIDFKTSLGQIQAGYIARGWWGTEFLNEQYTYPSITYLNSWGPWNVLAKTMKIREWRNRQNYGTGWWANGVANDSDGDAYDLQVMYKMKSGEAGLRLEYWRDAAAKSATLATMNNAAPSYGDGTTLSPTGNQGWTTNLWSLNPYYKGKFGNFYLEAEGQWKFGQLRSYESFRPGTTQQEDLDLSALALYINGRFDIKPAYVGGMFVYMSGDDMANTGKAKGSIAQFTGENYTSVGKTLILWNWEYYDSMGATVQGNMTALHRNPRTFSEYRGTRYLDNVWMYQLYGGVNVTPKLNVEGRVTYAYADQKPRMGFGAVGSTLTANTTQASYVGQQNKEFVDKEYGWEIDLTAKYKIYDNLTYTLGGGYLFIGDYFKGYDSGAQLKDNYMIMHRLDLFF